jgi:hypothetical protein
VTVKFKLTFLLSVIIALVQSLLLPPAAVSAQESKSKKLIYYGWGSPDTIYVRDHWKQMEEMPFDGAGIVVPIDRVAWAKGKRDTGNQLGWQVMARKVLRIEDFRDAIADLRSPKWRKFTDNFLPVALSASQWVGLNWFDDTWWRTAVNNFVVLARIAADSGVKGLILDPEHYDYRIFFYPDQRKMLDRSFENYKEKARQRGREIMAAMAPIIPQGILFSLYGYSLPFDYTRSGMNLADTPYGLLPAFYDGLLEAMPSGGRLIDGYEPAYFFKERTQFLSGHRKIKAAHTLSAHPAEYEKKVSAGFGLWIDYKQNPEYFTPEEWERAIKYALEISDEYVWVYSNGPRFFPPTAIAPSYLEALVRARREKKS